MQTFLQETLAYLKNKGEDLSQITFILPSKRAGSFLMHELKNTVSATQFAPTILSIEEFIENLSGLKIIDSTELLFKSYQAYLNTTAIKEKETFELYSNWATTILNDFNEIDRYLVEQDPFFNHLASIKSLEKWGVTNEKTELIESYLRFWEGLPSFYKNLRNLLLNENIGYQGMVYRMAAKNIEDYVQNNTSTQHIFIGFNALNASEQLIFQQLLETGNSQIFWDTDQVLYNDTKHSASYFLRKYAKEWPYFQENEFNFIGNNYQKAKKFQFVEVQKNIGQAKYVGELLANLADAEINKTAIVLGDENLLVPLLYSLPPNVKKINLTMGVSIKNFPAVTFFKLLFSLQIQKSNTLYYKDILSLLNHSVGAQLLPKAPHITQNLVKNNITHISPEELLETVEGAEKSMCSLLFKSWDDNSYKAISASILILNQLETVSKLNLVEQVVISQLKSVFNKIDALNIKYPHLKTVRSVHDLFLELVATTSLDFEGDAFSGLQLMGVLETRVLDFENVIITSVNEGIFPSGKSNASFITFDLKQQFNLPLFTEKDAVYTYHFYRLLHRAQQATLLYNNHSGGMDSNEKSRFIRQLEFELQPNYTINKKVLTPKFQLDNQPLREIEKTDSLINQLKEVAFKGFSPSALTSYIRNPIDFYFQKILNLNEFEEVEENVAANTLGTIVHDTLEVFYKPLEDQELTVEKLFEFKSQIHDEVTIQFKKTFKGGTFTKGKNLIVFEVAKRYIANFIDREIAEIKEGNKITIVKIEADLKVEMSIPELDFPVNIRGKVDRLDRYNGQLRIIDYKTGIVKSNNVEIANWEDLILDYKYSKAFQILAYALMISKTNAIENAQAGIISFKNLGAGFIKFGSKVDSKKAEYQITSETLEHFTTPLKNLILEICNKQLPFTEKEIDK